MDARAKRSTSSGPSWAGWRSIGTEGRALQYYGLGGEQATEPQHGARARGLSNNALELTSGELADGVARASRARHH